jgi:hypothetical protein
MSSISYLKQILTPPEVSSERPASSEWMLIEQKIGLALPQEYKTFIEQYGSGSIDNFLWILNPFSKNLNLNMVHQAKNYYDVFNESTRIAGTVEPYSYHPAKDGIFPWGITDNGDILHWLCKGKPESWKVVISENRCSGWHLLETGFLDTLIDIIELRFLIDCFPEDFPSRPSFFIPSTANS